MLPVRALCGVERRNNVVKYSANKHKTIGLGLEARETSYQVGSRVWKVDENAPPSVITGLSRAQRAIFQHRELPCIQIQRW
jgi:hypothetical protein